MNKVLVVLLILFLAIQIIRPPMNRSGHYAPGAVDRHHNVPSEVQRVLDRSCYDCHSNNTRYPWYAHIQPVGWWLADHISEGKEHLNFDEFGTYRPRVQYHMFEEIEEMVSEKEMPLSSYTLIHTDAILTAEDEQLLLLWTAAMRDSMKQRYPPDSLERKGRAG